MKTSYDPNERWEEIKAMPEHRFESPLFREVFQKSESWDLPAKYACIVRIDDIRKGTVTEQVFTKHKEAEALINELEANDILYCVYNASEMYASVLMLDKNEAEQCD